MSATTDGPELLGTVYFPKPEEVTGPPMQAWLRLARIITNAVMSTGHLLIFNSGGSGPDGQGSIDEVFTRPPLPLDQARAVAQLILSKQAEESRLRTNS